MKTLISKKCEISISEGKIQCITYKCPKPTGKLSVFDDDCFPKPREVIIKIGDSNATFIISTTKTDAQLRDILEFYIKNDKTFG